MKPKYTHPDGTTAELQPSEFGDFWAGVVADPAYEHGLSCNNLGMLQFGSDDSVATQLFFSKHPEDLWYFEFEDDRTGQCLVLHNPENNNDYWARPYMDPEIVCCLDESGNVYVNTLIGGAEYRVLHCCYVTPVEAQKVVQHFLESGTPVPTLNWVERAELDSRIFVG